MVASLNYEGTEFPVSQKNYDKIETKQNANVSVFGYKSNQAYTFYLSNMYIYNIII